MNTDNFDEYNNLLKKQNFITLYDIIKIFSDKKKQIIFISLSVGILATIIFFFIIDPIFISSALVKTTSKQSGLESLMSQSVPGLGDFSEIGSTGSMSKELILFENIIHSRRCVEEVITKFRLNDEWKFKYTQDAVRYFKENILEIQKDKTGGTLEIIVSDINPQRAKEIADFLVYQLNKINIELNVQHAKSNREFIEQRYNLLKTDLRKAEDSIKLYQDKYGLTPDVRLKTVATSEIQIETEIKTEEIKLDLLKKILSPDQSEIKIQEEKIALMKKQLDNILNNSDGSSNLQLKGAPDIIVNYARLYREVELQSKMLAYIMPIYEQAKIEEKKEMPSVIVIDHPYLPEHKTKPKRLLWIFFLTTASFISTYLYFLSFSVVKKYLNNANKISDNNSY